ncbi:transcriptional regulator, partial [Dokdonella sp.]|uniref:winged helix-turn-helix domain-containing protein n=1 Tax=Dokdonella sp. TaxID=2291710 RepID=UPI00260D2426
MSAPRSSAPRLAFRFGDYRLDVAARELHRRGELVVLSPKVFDCLAWLFEHRDRAVGRDELSAAVWGRADITDAQIDQLIRKVRRVLGDSGSDQEVIRTVPRFGYRWVAEVDTDAGPAGVAVTVENEAGDARSEAEETALAEGGMAVAAEPADREPRFPAPVPAHADGLASGRRRIPALLWGASLAAMVAVVVGGYLGWRGRAAGPGAVAVAPPAAGRTSYAVLPVTLDGEADSEWAWLRLGLMDLISARLREGGLAVVPASNIVALIDKKAEGPLDPAAVQAATGARVLVQPSVRRTDGGWRLRLEIEGAEAAAREMEVHADDAVGSARAAADRLLVLLGQAPVPDERDGDAGREVLARRIDAAISGGDYDAARQLLDTVPSARRDGAEFRLRRAYVERAVGHGTAARELFQAVLDADTARTLAAPIRTEALIGLGVMQLQGGDAAAARPRLDEAIELAQRERLPLAYADAMASRA